MSKNVVRYAQLHDTTVRRHWEAAGKVDIRGSTITFDPNGALADARPDAPHCHGLGDLQVRLSWPVRRHCGLQPTGPDDDTGAVPGQHGTNRQTKLANAGDVGSAHNDRLRRKASIVAIHLPWSL